MCRCLKILCIVVKLQVYCAILGYCIIRQQYQDYLVIIKITDYRLQIKASNRFKHPVNTITFSQFLILIDPCEQSQAVFSINNKNCNTLSVPSLTDRGLQLFLHSPQNNTVLYRHCKYKQRKNKLGLSWAKNCNRKFQWPNLINFH